MIQDCSFILLYATKYYTISFQLHLFQNNNYIIIAIFHNFFLEYAGVFEGAPTISGGEHNMEYFALFQIYLKLYEVDICEILHYYHNHLALIKLNTYYGVNVKLNHHYI